MSIHRTDCVNIIHLSESERARLIDAEWEQEEEKGIGEVLWQEEVRMYVD